MKRMKRISVYLLSVLLFCAALFSACAQETAAEPSLRAKLNRSVQSSRMTYSATLFNGEFTLAEEIAVYTRGDNGAELTLTRTTLAEDIAAESPYETTSFTAAVTESNYEAAAILPFDETAAECAGKTDGSVLLSVADPAAFFRTQDAAEYSDVSVKIEFAFDRPVSCRVEFDLPSGNSAVIVYTYSY